MGLWVVLPCPGLAVTSHTSRPSLGMACWTCKGQNGESLWP